MPRPFRKAHHAGSWYEKDAGRLARQIEEWLAQVTLDAGEKRAQAIIAPHAGYSYCGNVMAHAYSRINEAQVHRVFLLGPSHHYYTDRCLLSSAEFYQTPFGDIKVDEEVCSLLMSSGIFQVMDLSTDEAEHSLELHTPYLQHVLRGKSFELVPIMIGVLSIEMETVFASVLSPYLDDRSNLFIISSDFCHWGSRFRYTPYNTEKGPIWKYIEWLDWEGIRAIEKGDTMVFREYLKETRNTICGRYPISLFLNMMQQCGAEFDISFKHYAQSSKCFEDVDSSVSYAAGVICRKD